MIERFGISAGASGNRRVLLLGATGTIGRATVRALLGRGHEVVCFIRPRGGRVAAGPNSDLEALAGAEVRLGVLTDPVSWQRDALRGEHFDAIVSCLASRTGAPCDAQAIDLGAHRLALAAAQQAGIAHFVLLSAICVQKPLLAFQRAKLAFEAELRASALSWSIVRPTAYFKSLAGQVERVRRGRPFLVFGDGSLTACKPISDRDVAEYLAGCLEDPARHNRVLPIGGPGDAITPRQQGEHLFALLGRPPRFRQVPVAMLDFIVGALSLLARVVPSLADKAEFARIGRYYATESMLVLDPTTGKYEAAATPSTGSDLLFDYYAQLLERTAYAERGEHAVFKD